MHVVRPVPKRHWNSRLILGKEKACLFYCGGNWERGEKGNAMFIMSIGFGIYLRVEAAGYFYACRISKKTTKFVE